MASEYVNLIKNPSSKNPKRNPRKNPNGILEDITKPLPDAETLIYGAVGAVAALVTPMFLRVKSDIANVVWSAAGTLGAGFVAQRVAGVPSAKAAVLGGALVTALQVPHMATRGAFGLPPGLTAGSALQPPAAMATAEMPAGSSGMGRAALNGSSHGVNAFRESEFRSPPPPEEEPVLV